MRHTAITLVVVAPILTSRPWRIGGLRSRDHWRRIERRQHRARRRRTRPARHPAGAGRPRRGRLLGLAAADPWRSGWCWSAGIFFASVRRSPSATSGSDRAASGAPDAALRSPPIPTSVRRGSCARGCLLYDRLASRSGLPASATVDVTHHPVGNALKRPFGTAFEYSDCVVDDSGWWFSTPSMPRRAAP